MIALGLTTSTPHGSVALVGPAGVLAAVSYSELTLHAEKLFAAVDELLLQAGLKREAIGCVACDVGPGSFTGVRVGVAAASGVSLGLAIPTVGVLSLRAMAEPILGAGADEVIAVLDAQKSEVFLASFDREGKLNGAPRHIAKSDAHTELLVAAGRGVALCGAVLDELGLAEQRSLLLGSEWPRAEEIARVALSEPRFGRLEPVYVRAPDAKPRAT